MRYTILLPVFYFISIVAFSQQTNYAYIITSPGNNKFIGWSEVKLIDLTTGKQVQNIFEAQNRYSVFDARSKKLLKTSTANTATTVSAVKTNAAISEPFDTYCAATAFDAKTQRLYFTPMGINQLRYMEPQSGKIFYFNDETFGVAKDITDLPNHITRMTFDPNGIGYALSNDANHFISFTTGKKPVITELGSLTDDPSNKDVSIHTQVPSWGGDMVADRFGNLYMISAKQALFKINIQSKEAKFLGYVKGFPQDFTTNGAAVDNEGNLIVSSASSTAGYYKVDISMMSAGKYCHADSVFIGSDMANGNFLFENKTKAALSLLADANKISVYPNPVTNGIVHTNFNNLSSGKYIIQVVDQSGKTVAQKNVSVRFAGQVDAMDFSNKLAKGTYVIKVSSKQNSAVNFATQIIVE